MATTEESIQANLKAAAHHYRAGHTGPWRSCSRCQDARNFVPLPPEAAQLDGGSGLEADTGTSTLDPRGLRSASEAA